MTEYSSLKASCTRMHADFITKSRTIPLEFATPCLQSPIDSVVWTGLLIKTLYNYHFTANSFLVIRRHSPAVIKTCGGPHSISYGSG